MYFTCNDKCINIKKTFEFEPYMTLLSGGLKIGFIQFRLGNTKLPIETDRWFNVDYFV